MRRDRLALVLASLTLPVATSAQTIRGRVVSRAGTLDVPGAVVLLIDSAATTTYARTLSNERGEYLLRAPAPGRYALRALRIGFRPTTTAAFALAADTAIVLRIADIPAVLPPIATRERAQCRIRPDSGLLTFALWEQARTALLATAITQDDAGYGFDAVHHSRLLMVRGASLRDVSFTDSTRSGAVSWRSRSPEALRADGYVTRDSAGIDFVAPDIEVLLSPYFADTHCLRLNDRPPAGSGLVGLDFAPAGRPRHVEIRGTLWLDEHTRELRTLDFRYDNFAYRGVDSLAGGQAHFARLATGAWVMTDWVTRMPVPPKSPDVPGLQRIALTPSSGRWTTDRVRVTGGDLRAVVRDTATLWRRATGGVRLRLSSVSGAFERPVANAVVSLVGSDHSTLSDTTGTAAFDRLIAGSYLVEATTEELQILGRPPAVSRVDVRAGAVVDARMTVERSVDAIRAICGDHPGRPGMIVGLVTRGGDPVPDELLAIHWMGRVDTLFTAPTGRFRLCGVPLSAPIVFHSRGDSVRQTVTLDGDRLVRSMTFLLPAPQPVTRDEVSAPIESRRRRR